MLLYEPSQRLTINEIKQHSWFTGSLPSHVEVLAEFRSRKELNDDVAKEDQVRKKAEKRTVYGKHRGFGDVEPDEEEKEEVKIELTKPI